jgi:hypothetical protein
MVSGPPGGQKPMNEFLSQVQTKLHKRFREIVGNTDNFCKAHLNSEFRDICRALAVTIFQEGLPVTSGKAASWAAGIVGSVGFVNFLGDPSQPYHMTMDEMAPKIGVSPATLHNKAKVIRDSLGIRRMDPRFSTKEMIDRNPLVWMVDYEGIPFDIRRAPRKVQEAAFQKGLIPYLPNQ